MNKLIAALLLCAVSASAIEITPGVGGAVQALTTRTFFATPGTDFTTNGYLYKNATNQGDAWRRDSKRKGL